MIRNLKALGTALVVVSAMGAVGASTVSGADLFTTQASKAWVTGVSHDHVFTITGKEPAEDLPLECTTSRFTATMINGSSEATVGASYSGTVNKVPDGTHCTFFEFFSSTVHMNGCHHRLSGETFAKHGALTDAIVSIVCPPGKEIVITNPFGCIMKIPSQTPTEGGVTYHNLPNHPGGSAIQITTTITGITYTANGACSTFNIPQLGDNTDYTGTVTVTGYAHQGGTLGAPVEGTRLPIEVS